MIEFTLLSMRNFLSYGNNTTVLDLRRPGTTLIVGENLDLTSDGVGANGVGKSSIINAIVYAIYDNPVSDISKDNLINNTNQKNMEVTLEFIGDDGCSYKIHRQRKMKTGAVGNNVYFYKDGVDVTLDSMSATNAEIERVIGIPYRLFVRIIVFSASNNPFLSLKTDEQKHIIEELFGLTAITEKADVLKKHIKDTEHTIAIQQVTIDASIGENLRHQNLIKSEQTRVTNWDITNKATIKQLTEKLSLLEGVDVDTQQQLHDTLKTADDQLRTYLDEKRVIERAINDFSTNRANAEAELKHLTDKQCPYCLQTYTNNEAKIQLTQDKIRIIDEELPKLKLELKDVTDDVTTMTHAIKELRSRVKVDDIDSLIQIKNESTNIKQKIVDLTNTPNPYSERLQELMDVQLPTADYTKINELTNELDHQKFLLKLLTKKDSFVRKALLNKNLPYLNTKLQHYLTMLGLPHRVEFTKEMSSTISQFGRSLNFGNLSQGQRARVNFALSLAFKDVLQNLHPKINICLLDEVLDFGLDTVGVTSAARLVKQKAKDDGLCMYVISHKDEVNTIFDKKITIQMSKGFSYIIDDVVR